MGIFDFLKRNKGAHKPKKPAPISNDDYTTIRQAEIDWLEAHYDLNSAEGIRSIPERSDLPRPTFGDGGGFRSYTADIDYYLRNKGFAYEDAGDIDMAILCLKKSNAIRMVSRRGYRKDDYYSYVRLLARNGYVSEAEAEKRRIDAFFGGDVLDNLPGFHGEMDAEERQKQQYNWDHMIEFEAKRGETKREYKWLQDNLPALCPKSYSGYMRMKKQETKNYKIIVSEAEKLGYTIQ